MKKDKKIDQLVFEWFTQQRVKQIRMSGPILQEKARQATEQLAYSSETFKASNDGCLEKFCNRHAKPPCNKRPRVFNYVITHKLLRGVFYFQ